MPGLAAILTRSGSKRASISRIAKKQPLCFPFPLADITARVGVHDIGPLMRRRLRDRID